ncbi:glycosyltransferase family 9 protein [Phragmitibacter flavus]|uniref:Glycosyltransferase family 9 protein n=1 Tax=Phragmitibacter flavus TaxID=2576071 RepID=A0A5R8K7V1_9BACT|nr:glycosyltransferase family 9 protein [Phragmitibacter flavus]TLD68434.1 glycosyltransferase family 9 protein [Phragmitibacter flavus]
MANDSVTTRERWRAEIKKRVGGFLDIKSLRSLFVMVPGVSGDVCLTTPLLRHVKEQNPDCHVTFVTNEVTFGVAKLCPYIDEIALLPSAKVHNFSRNWLVEHFAGRADAVIYPNCVRQDVDLLETYNAVEVIWLIAGIEGGVPEEGVRFWLDVPGPRRSIEEVLRTCTGHGLTYPLVKKRLTTLANGVMMVARRAMFDRTHLPIAIKHVRHELSKWAKPAPAKRLKPMEGSRYVLLGTGAKSLRAPTPELINEMVRMLSEAGFTVLHNVLDPFEAAPDTIPLLCSHEEFLRLRLAGVPFVGWRSGLCDIAAAAPAPMCVLYPAVDNYARPPMELFGFKSMKVQCNCQEFICEGISDLRDPAMLQFLEEIKES